MSGANTPSPTGSGGPMDTSVHEKSCVADPVEQPPAVRDVYTTESETHTPTKEEIETNEKNLLHNASYLGQLIFKLRYVSNFVTYLISCNVTHNGTIIGQS